MLPRFILLIWPLQILQEELVKFKQQAEKTRVQKLHQVNAFCCRKIFLIFYSLWSGSLDARKEPIWQQQ
jgi:hypothetical protein